MIKELLTGFCLGAANIIPGVSGGTFLLIFNLYDRLFSILSAVNARLLKETARYGIHIIMHPFDRSGYRRMAAVFHENDFFFSSSYPPELLLPFYCCQALLNFFLHTTLFLPMRFFSG